MRTTRMSESEILDALNRKEAIRFVPRSISGIKPGEGDDDAEERDLFCGRKRLANATAMVVVDMYRRKLVRFVRRGPMSFVELR